jgi:hypothetical protein
MACLLGLAALFPGCAPIFSDLQGARLVGPGNIEATPGFSSVYISENGKSEQVQNHLGLQAGIGILSSLDLRLRYERVLDYDLNAVGFGPKIALVKDRVAFYVPVGFAFGEDVKSSETWETHPTLLFTFPVAKSFELNPSAKVLIPLSGERDTLFAFNLGAAVGNVRKWAIRPEVGLCFNPGESGFFWQFSIGLSLSTN